jgi:hypothetical protein
LQVIAIRYFLKTNFDATAHSQNTSEKDKEQKKSKLKPPKYFLLLPAVVSKFQAFY